MDILRVIRANRYMHTALKFLLRPRERILLRMQASRNVIGKDTSEDVSSGVEATKQENFLTSLARDADCKELTLTDLEVRLLEGVIGIARETP